ncbi:MAG TPA: zinc-dependent alcohol dehydrogenase family protein [Tepidisphaeraceae bacterium]|nr:zinc-dependent alcohol dehydrogenase family protein [Tepidisphaeraceae bacterium]
MRAMVLSAPASIDNAPLAEREIPDAEAGPGEIRVKVKACGICRTDLHVVEGELPPVTPHIVPGHQIVGIVDQLGPGAHRFAIGDRVGIAWLRWTCGQCRYCRAGNENLCPKARFTGYHENGGYAERAVVREDFAYALPPQVDDLSAAPLLCAGIIGFRALRRAEVKPGCRLGLYGFGASAHLAIQVARHWGCTVYVMTRESRHQALARQLGADWAGGSEDRPPDKLDSAILFAPVGTLVLPALDSLDYGGTLAVAGIYLSDIPPLNYESKLFHEKTLRSVTANTRQDGLDLLKVAAEIPLRPRTTAFPLRQANDALRQLKHDGISGAGVLTPD